MKTRNKALALMLCAVLLVAGSVLGTMAYMTSNDTVTNTFTVGNVKITLDETDVDVDGVATGEDRDKANDYKLMPGHDYIKDPIVHVDDKSEDCWLFVEVTNPIADIEADYGDKANNKIADQMLGHDWVRVDREKNIFAYKNICTAGEDVPVFDGFAINPDVTDLTDYKDAQIVVTAYAVQADGFETAIEAWNAAGLRK